MLSTFAAACVLAFSPAPAPDHAAPDMAAAWAEVQAARLVEARHERFHCLVEVNAGPWTPPAEAVSSRSRGPAVSAPPPGGVEAWRPLVSGYGWNVDLALLVIWCESRGDPGAQHPESRAAGLFQMMPGWYLGTWNPSAVPAFDPFDPAANVAAAWVLWLDGHGGGSFSPHWDASAHCWA